MFNVVGGLRTLIRGSGRLEKLTQIPAVIVRDSSLAPRLTDRRYTELAQRTVKQGLMGSPTKDQQVWLSQLKTSGDGLVVSLSRNADGFTAEVCRVGKRVFNRIKGVGDAFQALGYRHNDSVTLHLGPAGGSSEKEILEALRTRLQSA